MPLKGAAARHQPIMPNITETLSALKKRDLHVHTVYCNHAVGSMEDYVRAAVAAGLEEIGFLEHAEAGIQSDHRTWLDDGLLETYYREACALRKKYERDIKVSIGLEMGANPDQVTELKRIAALHPWDRIGLSYHFPLYEGGRVLITSSSLKRQVDPSGHLELNLEYYRTLREQVAVFRPDMVCHLDVVRRHMTDQSGRAEVRESIIGLLDEMARCGTALEINTSGYRHGLERPYPDAWIVAEAVKRGIGLAFCSDSHQPGDLGRDFDRAEIYVSRAIQLCETAEIC